MQVNWRKFFEHWSEISEERRRRLSDLLKGISKVKRYKLFLKEPYAKKIYEELVFGLTVEDEEELKTTFEARLREATISPRRWMKMFEDRLTGWKETFGVYDRRKARELADKELGKLIEEVRALVKPKPPPKVPVVPKVPTFKHPVLSEGDVKRLWEEFVRYGKMIGVEAEKYADEFTKAIAEATTYDRAMELTWQLARKLPVRRPPVRPRLPVGFPMKPLATKKCPVCGKVALSLIHI